MEPPTASQDERGLGTYDIKYRVITDSTMSPAVVITSCEGLLSPNDAVPPLYATYSYAGDTDIYAYCRSRSARPLYPKEGRMLWEITVQFRPLDPGKDANDQASNPLARGVEYSFDWEVYTETVTKDKDDKEIVNSAGKPFDINIEMERSRSVIVASYNVANLAVAINKCLKYQDAVNSVTWDLGGATISPRVALCRNVQASGLITEGNTSYYRITFRVAFNEQTWDENILSTGFGYLEVPNDKDTYVKALDDDGSAATEPILLKEDGTKKNPADAPYFNEYRVRKEVSFVNIFNYAIT